MRSIQILVLFIAISSIQCWSDRMKENILKWEDECLDETDVDEELAKQALATHQYPDDAGFKNFIFCLLKKFGIMDNDGNAILSAMTQLIIQEGFDKSVADNILEKCAARLGGPVDKVFSGFLCYQEVAPEEIRL